MKFVATTHGNGLNFRTKGSKINSTDGLNTHRDKTDRKQWFRVTF